MKTPPLPNRGEIEFDRDRQSVEALATIGKDAMQGDFLPRCNEKASWRNEALRRALITFASREIHSATFRQSANNRFADSRNDAGSVLDGNGK